MVSIKAPNFEVASDNDLQELTVTRAASVRTARENNLSNNNLPIQFPSVASDQEVNIRSVTFSFSRQLLPTGGDGNYYDRNGNFVAPNTPLESITAFIPESGPITSTPIIYVNGVNTDTGKLADCAQNIADSTGQPVVPLYNHTKGSTVDTLQAMSDKFNLLENPAATSLANIIIMGFYGDSPPHIMAHSQGALVTSRALFEARASLVEDSTLDRQAVDDYFSKITVESFGGAASVYPPGPRYIHYAHSGDAVSFFLGVGKCGLSHQDARQVEIQIDAPAPIKSSLTTLYGASNPISKALVEPGDRSRVVHIENEQNLPWLEAHKMSLYLKHRRTPEEVHASDSADREHQSTKVGQFLVALNIGMGGTGIVGTLARLSSHLKKAKILIDRWLEGP